MTPTSGSRSTRLRPKPQALLDEATQLEESGDRIEARQLRDRATALLAANDKSRDYYLRISRGWRPNDEGELRPPSSGAAEQGDPIKAAPSFNDLIRETRLGGA